VPIALKREIMGMLSHQREGVIQDSLGAGEWRPWREKGKKNVRERG
jgi:hypothetical protein